MGPPRLSIRVLIILTAIRRRSKWGLSSPDGRWGPSSGWAENHHALAFVFLTSLAAHTPKLSSSVESHPEWQAQGEPSCKPMQISAFGVVFRREQFPEL